MYLTSDRGLGYWACIDLKDSYPLRDFQRNTKAHLKHLNRLNRLKHLNKASKPQVLTVNGLTDGCTP